MTTMLAILGFLALMVINDHTNIAAILQWQDDYGKKIDSISSNFSGQAYKQSAIISVATSTNFQSQ